MNEETKKKITMLVGMVDKLNTDTTDTARYDDLYIIIGMAYDIIYRLDTVRGR
jgi:hypothetical protein